MEGRVGKVTFFGKLAARIAAGKTQRVTWLFHKRAGDDSRTYLCRAGFQERIAHVRTQDAPGEIALQCGFYDQSQFGKLFRREAGITPLAPPFLSATRVRGVDHSLRINMAADRTPSELVDSTVILLSLTKVVRTFSMKDGKAGATTLILELSVLREIDQVPLWVDRTAPSRCNFPVTLPSAK